MERQPRPRASLDNVVIRVLPPRVVGALHPIELKCERCDRVLGAIGNLGPIRLPALIMTAAHHCGG